MIKSIRNAFDPIDGILLAAAVLGFALYVFVLPRIHPDRMAGDHAHQEDVVAAARAFLMDHAGYEMEGGPTRVRIRRDPALLDSIRHRAIRQRTIRKHPPASGAADGAALPAYYWEARLVDVVANSDGAEDGGRVEVGISTDDELDDVASVRLTLDGRPFSLELDEPVLSFERVHRAILEPFIGDTLMRGALDTVTARRWTFRFDERRSVGSSGFLADPPRFQPRLSASEGRVVLDEEDAAALALHHLQGTLLGAGRRFGRPQADSVALSGQAGYITATVYVSIADSTFANRVRAEVELAPTGALVGLRPHFVEAAPSDGFEGSDALDVGGFVVFVLLSLLALVVFLRRIRHQLVDVTGAFRDALALTLLTALAIFGSAITEVPWPFRLEHLFMILGLSLVSLMAGVLVFFTSGATTSVGRDVWSDKLVSLDLLREAYVLNRPVGCSLVRGVLVGFISVGAACAVLWVFPSVGLKLSGEPVFYAMPAPGLGFLSKLGEAAFSAYFFSFLVVLFTGALSYQKLSSPWAVAAIVAIALALTKVAPMDLQPVWASFAFSAGIGLLLAWTILRFDLISVVVAVLVFVLMWGLAGGWLVAGAPEFVDSILGASMVAGLASLGVAGVVSGRTRGDVPTIIPEYIAELARKERLEREMELARSMQLSFLPATTPKVAGLDVASHCLPAYEVGGDYYDFFLIGERRLGFVVGDVSGKGMEAAFYMTLMKGILQSVMWEGTGPQAALVRANELFRANSSRDTFMSMALGVFDLEREKLVFARAGHNPPLLRRRGRSSCDELKPAGPALGLLPPATFGAHVEEIEVALHDGDRFVIYTDGVTEAMNRSRELFGEERLRHIVRTTTGSSQAVLERIVDEVKTFTEGAPSHDDMTLVVVQVVPAATPPAAGS